MVNKPTVHYLSLRNIPEFEKENRRNPPSGQKQDYIIDTLISLGYNVNYVSFSESFNKKCYRAKKKKLSEKLTFFLCPNIESRFRESIAFRWFYHIYAAYNIKQGDILLVYHTNSMRNDILRKLADKKHLKFIYEVEEVYAYAHETVLDKQINEEIEFLQCPDAYLFNSELLCKRVNQRNLKYTIVEGFYKYTRSDVKKFNDGKIHCVYGGIIDQVKGGAFRAVAAANYLPSNYVIHILGFGETQLLKNYIEDNIQNRKCQVIFEGLKNGQEYIDFISKCDIGLSLMTMREDLNSTAFPSKLILYLSVGLHVVAGRVRVLELSKVADYINFYNEDTPQSIAQTIMSIDMDSDYNSEIIMNKLDKEFQANLIELLSM